MIIDTGSDLLQLTERRLWKHERTSPLVAVVMTGDLELYFVKTITKHYTGCLDDHHEQILRAVDKDYARYFAVAHRSVQARHEFIDFDESHRLEQKAAEVGLHLIGDLHVDREYWCSTGPMSFFKTYLCEDDLPKISSRRPRHFAKTRLAGGAEVECPDDGFYQRFGYELSDEDPDRKEIRIG
ncbi:MAG: hypothetical protein EPN48_04845 [Microbacteriaceae bacterium]|nr:MAG: hypothetical protein EPN48_04845 [Microbacteriaceae bacterium]